MRINDKASYSAHDYMAKRHFSSTKFLLIQILLIACILFSALCMVLAADADLEDKVKAAYVYNFTKFVHWEKKEGDSTKVPIRICVLGTDSIGDLLEELSNRQVEGRPLQVERNTSNISDIPHCNVLFISRSEEQQLPLIMQQLIGSNVLTTSDIPRFSKRGGMIGFVTEGGRIKIEINLTAAQRAGLKISSKLLEVARIIQ